MSRLTFETLEKLLDELLYWKEISGPVDGYYLDEIESRVFKIREELSIFAASLELSNKKLPELLLYRTLSVEDMSIGVSRRLFRRIDTVVANIRSFELKPSQETLDACYYLLADLYKTFKEIADG